MKRSTCHIATAMVFFISIGVFAQPAIDQHQQFADIGNLVLENGQQIKNCRVGYRTFGKLTADRSNAVVFPTAWGDYSGRLQYLVPGRYVDTTKYFLILVDALGNGVSSSPSNSSAQPKTQFPTFNIGDMVKSQYQFLVEKMNIRHVVAVGGFSMGGMQAFQWSVSYPDFMDKILTIEGTPTVTAHDLLWTNIYLSLITNDKLYQGGNYASNPVLPNASRFVQMIMATPEIINKTVKADSFGVWLDQVDRQSTLDYNDLVWQLKASMSHDIRVKGGGTLEDAARKTKAKFLIITNKQDHTVNPQPSIHFAGLLNAKLVVLDSEMGHVVLFDETPVKAFREFLAQ